MLRYIDADALKPDYILGSTSTNTECYRYVLLKQIANAPTVDVEKIATEYCMKHSLVMISMASYETLVAYYGRRNGLLFDERIEDDNDREQ